MADTAERALANIGTMGVALSPVTVPVVGKPTFTIAEDEMEIGMGIHGELASSVRNCTAQTRSRNADNAILEDADPGRQGRGDDNSLGATPLEELMILYNKVDDILKANGLVVYRYAGNLLLRWK